ncbi:MAG: nickel/cobalt transporter [Candidatus Binatia bacterium]
MNTNRIFVASVPLVFVLLVVFGIPTRSVAHPMGNFSINHFSALTVSPDTVRLSYVIDMAEIPTFQEMQEAGDIVRADDLSAQAYRERKAQELQRGLILQIGRQTIPFSPRSSQLTFPPGAGGLPTLRLVVEYEAPLSSASGAIVFEDRNYPDRAGWKEIVAHPQQGVVFEQSSVPRESRSQQLTNYATDLLQAPPQDLRAILTFSVSETIAVAGASPKLGMQSVSAPLSTTRTPQGWFTDLITVRQLTPGIMLLSLAIALGLGAFHAFEPGHGKTLVAAYLVGSRGTPWHALILGLTVTLSHTLSVFLLGAVALFASHYIVPEQLYPWLELISGLLIAGMGLLLLRHAWLRYYRHVGRHDHDHVGYDYRHHHHHASGQHPHISTDWDYDYYHEHSHEEPEPVSYRALLTLGVTGGMIPCPGALVVLLSAVALQRVAFGLLLIVAFSLGLAAVLVATGLLLVSARGFVQRWSGDGPWQTYLPFLSPLVMTPLGIVLVLRAVTSGGLL